MALWVKNLTAVAWVTFSPWPGNFYMPRVQPLKKKKLCIPRNNKDEVLVLQ